MMLRKPNSLLHIQQRAMRRFRVGISLLEVMIVLVIMAGIAALAWPNLQKSLQRTGLNESAAIVRELLAETRYRASTDGQSYVIRLETGSSQLSVGSMEQVLPERSSMMAAAPQSNPTLASQYRADGVRSHTLPESVVVSQVRWSSEENTIEPDEESGSIFTQADSDDPVNEPREPAAESGVELGTTNTFSHQAFWLPILASCGQGRDVTITLTDTSAKKSVEVSFCAATGNVEVLR